MPTSAVKLTAKQCCNKAYIRYVWMNIIRYRGNTTIDMVYLHGEPIDFFNNLDHLKFIQMDLSRGIVKYSIY